MEHPKNKTNLHFKWQPALFLLVLLTVYFALGFQNIVRERPQSVHQWAQCDRASVAMVMHKEGISFSKPQTHNIENSTGITGMEFPFVNACAATLYNVFGPYEALYRLIILAFVTVGLLAAYMFTFDITGNALTAGLIVLLFFLSPVLVYYTPNFIPDSPSMALILVFWLFFLRYLKQPSWGLLFLLGIIGLLASLIKISSLLSIITALCIVLLALAGQLKKHVSLNRKFSYGAIGVLLFIGMSTYGWYSYAAWLNAVYHSDVFIMHAPIVTNPNKIGELFTIAMDEWGYQYYSTPVHILWGLLAIACIALWKKVNRLVGLITLLLHLGGACFYLIMIGQFRHHDYYIIPLLPAFLFLLITFVDLLQRLPRFNSRFVLPVALTVICSYQFTVAQANLESRYNKTSDFYGVNNDYYFELENYLQSINLQYNDAVISFADSSPNVTLYLMNRRGITFRDFDDKTAIVASMKKAKYIVNNQPSIHDHAYLQPYLQNPIGKFGIIEVYKITQP